MVENIEVFNKSAGMVVYEIPNSPSHGIRSFAAGKSQVVPVRELIDLGQQPGGTELFYNYLFVNDPEVIQAIFHQEPEIEYWLTEDKIPDWMVSCSLEEFIDALNFAPMGTKDIIKKLAVDNELNDNNKRQAIKDILGYDVTAAIEAARPDEGEEVQQQTKTGRLAASSSITRTAAAPSIKVPEETEKPKIIITKNNE